MRRVDSPWLPLLFSALLACDAERDGDPQSEPKDTDAADSADDTAADSGQEVPVGATISHGPMVGGVSDTSAIVWARLEGAGSARVVYSADPSFALAETTTTIAASEAADWTLQFPLTGLLPATLYSYRVETGGEPRAGTFRTFPEPDQNVDFRFVVFADIASALAAPAYEAAFNEDPAFLLQIGDFDHNDPAAVGVGDEIDVENWRAMHRRCLGDGPHGQDLATWILPSIPIFHMWDDHDYGANNAGGDAVYRDVATQAFLEYYPVGDRPNPGAGLWYSFRYGQVEVFMLDLRSQRDPFDDATIPVKSVLVREPMEDDQLQWLERGLLASTARWKVVVSTSVWNPHSKTNDSWMNYPEEQAEIVALVEDNNLPGVMVVSGDIHSGGALDDGENSWFPELSVPVTNFYSNACTGECGTWSVGLNDPDGNRAGYGMLEFTYNPESKRHTAVLSAHNWEGRALMEYAMVAE
ncbi:hypothetical protein LBMAG42_51700 [Deltaproteobacteria bacterium]|nr:hypothetical protein LBMAG42_51700 [Deltaproteobacteria bacterium]